jgi:uncharacterized membrane protein YkoI
MSLRALLIAVVAAGALAGAGTPSHAAAPERDSLGAGWREQQEEARRAVREGRHVPLARIIDQIRRMTPGRQLDAGIEAGTAGRAVYRVRWAADNGRRLDYLVDAETGTILAVEGR